MFIFVTFLCFLKDFKEKLGVLVYVHASWRWSSSETVNPLRLTLDISYAVAYKLSGRYLTKMYGFS